MRIIFAILLLGLGGEIFAGRTLAVALAPQREVAEALAGEGWEVIVALPAGREHEHFSPTPGQVRGLQQAEVFWASGMGFETLLLPRLQAMNPDLRIVRPEGVETHPASAAHDHDHHDHDHAHHGHGHEDLHRWLDPRRMAEDAALLANALAGIDPAGAETYARRLAAFEGECAELSKSTAELLGPYAGESIFVYHAAFGHFAEAFGLEQRALEVDGREPSLRDLSELIAEARTHRVRVIYVQPQHRPASAEAMARALDARLVSLDPLAEDWAANLRRIAEQFAADLAARREAGA